MNQSRAVISIDDGNWSSTQYTFAQRVSSLEIPEFSYPLNAVYGDSFEHKRDDFVNATTFYKYMNSNRVLMDVEQIRSSVTNITRNRRGFWRVHMINGRHVDAKSVDVCTGLGTAVDVIEICQKWCNNVDKIINDKRLYRLVSANAYMLSDKYLTDKRKKIAVYGGGGSSSAAVRKAIFNGDRNRLLRRLPVSKVCNDVFWFSRTDMSSAGNGDLVNDKKKWMSENNLIFTSHELHHENGIVQQKNGKLTLNFTNGKSYKDFDQFVFAVGQDINGDEDVPGASLLLDNNANMKIVFAKIDQFSDKFIPVCIADDTKTLVFHGAAATAFCNQSSKNHCEDFNKASQKRNHVSTGNVFANLLSRSEGRQDMMPEDNRYVGTMPSAMECMRTYYMSNNIDTYMSNSVLQMVNVNTAFSIRLLVFFSRMFDLDDADKLMKYIINRRTDGASRTGGITNKELVKIATKYKLKMSKDYLTVLQLS